MDPPFPVKFILEIWTKKMNISYFVFEEPLYFVNIYLNLTSIAVAHFSSDLSKFI